jgi:hypothetical protein
MLQLVEFAIGLASGVVLLGWFWGLVFALSLPIALLVLHFLAAMLIVKPLTQRRAVSAHLKPQKSGQRRVTASGRHSCQSARAESLSRPEAPRSGVGAKRRAFTEASTSHHGFDRRPRQVHKM